MPTPVTSPFGYVVRARRRWLDFDLSELWRYRELFLLLSWRDFLLRYKQTVLGVAWALLQPLLTMVIFTVIFDRLARFPSHGVPYAALTLSALLPWNLFATALTESSGSCVAASGMISKVYFPRLLIPASAAVSGVVDFGVSFLLLVILNYWWRVPLSPRLVFLPCFLLATLVIALAFGFWLSALNVKYRDVKYVVPLFTRLGLYVAPVGFVTALVGEKLGPRWAFWYSLNPMVGVIDGFRWCLLGEQFAPAWLPFGLGMLAVLIVLAGGLLYFHRAQSEFADVI